AGDRKPFPFLQSPFDEYGATFSPDGKWIAYNSEEGGAPECYVRPFPVAEGRWQVSTNGTDGGCSWSRDGKEIFYFTQEGTLMAVPISMEPSFRPGVPKALFQKKGIRSGDAAADGRRFLLAVREESRNTLPISLILNWTEITKR
ncbi:MAG TPA: hypothetical protein VFG76_02580, partial [Candidatus Polarisedimenticolia bacterium]|nr:hypothetical protein [Candidatus Polarisedimenticolia bacterium]